MSDDPDSPEAMARTEAYTQGINEQIDWDNRAIREFKQRIQDLERNNESLKSLMFKYKAERDKYFKQLHSTTTDVQTIPPYASGVDSEIEEIAREMYIKLGNYFEERK